MYYSGSQIYLKITFKHILFWEKRIMNNIQIRGFVIFS